MGRDFNRYEQRNFRRQLRRNSPPAEMILWNRLRGKQLANCKFRRQHGVGPYCLDFYCSEIRLAIELDGESHYSPEARAYDADRQGWIESLGIQILRYTNTDIYENIEGVCAMILATIEFASRTEGMLQPLDNSDPAVPPSPL